MPDIGQTPASDAQRQDLLDKRVFPTALRSDEIRLFWSDELKKQSVFSARTTSKQYLDRVKELLGDYQTAIGQTAEGGPISQGLQRTRMLMREKLEELGLVERDEKGNVVERMTNLGSAMRLNLIIKTNTQLAHSARQKMAAQDPVQRKLRPYFELVRDERREKPRNWYDLWLTASSKVGGEGVVKGTTRMIATVDSPIWSVLGHAFPDSIGTDMPPFCWGSGMGWRPVRKKEVEELGLGLGV